jgi:hypothetical protein
MLLRKKTPLIGWRYLCIFDMQDQNSRIRVEGVIQALGLAGQKHFGHVHQTVYLLPFDFYNTGTEPLSLIGASKGESLQVNSLPHSFRSSFSTSTLFRITPAPEVSHTLTVQAPVGNLDDLRFVETGTALVILACFAYLARVAWHAFRQLGAEATTTGSLGTRHAKVD